VPVEADRVAHAANKDLHAAAVEAHAADMGIMVRVGVVDVPRRADRYVELLVRADRDELPAMRLVLRELVDNEDRLRRVVEVVLDRVEPRDLGQLGDVEGALVEGEPIRPMQPGRDDLDFTFTVLVADGVHLVDYARADEDCALLTDAQRARVGDAGREHLDLEAGRGL
jgi:hypothetical protein